MDQVENVRSGKNACSNERDNQGLAQDKTRYSQNCRQSQQKRNFVKRPDLQRHCSCVESGFLTSVTMPLFRPYRGANALPPDREQTRDER